MHLVDFFDIIANELNDGFVIVNAMIEWIH